MAPLTPTTTEMGTGLALHTEEDLSSSSPSLFRARPSVFTAGNRLTLGYRHFSPKFGSNRLTALSWVTAGFDPAEGRQHLAASMPVLLPAIDNIAGGRPEVKPATANQLNCELNLDYLRGFFRPRLQHMI